MAGCDGQPSFLKKTIMRLIKKLFTNCGIEDNARQCRLHPDGDSSYEAIECYDYRNEGIIYKRRLHIRQRGVVKDGCRLAEHLDKLTGGGLLIGILQGVDATLHVV